jgi:Domain of unknown function (DUF4129)
MYREPLLTRISDAIEGFLSRLFRDADRLPGGWWSTIALLAILVLVVAGVTFWIRPTGSRRSSGLGVLSGTSLSARDHRELAERLADGDDYGAAIVERMRALAAEIEERGILPVRPGRTAGELAVQAGRVLPDLAADFSVAAGTFDDVRYGGRDGTAAGYERISRVDDEVRAARAGALAADGVGAGLS